ncbi:MAG TPA: hypothetical protein VGL56_04860 [Fimbriimonadaceae bacterium]|jgi:hypothetical protein
MELDELKSTWQLMNARLERTETMVVSLEKRARRDKSRSALAWFRALPTFDLIAGLVMAMIYCKFISSSYSLTYMVCWGLLFAFNLAGIISASWQIATVSSVDFGLPVLQIQARLAKVKAVRLFTTRWSLIVALLLWVPMSVVFCQIVFHFDLVAKAGWGYVLANVALGVIAIPVIIWSSRRFGAALSKNPGIKRIADDMAGRSLIKAMSAMDELAEFEGT